MMPTEKDDREYTQTISEIREWLVKIDTNQAHQTKLLETINQQAANAFAKADSAEDTAELALLKAEQNKKEFESYIEEEKTNRRWLIGTLVTICIALMPLFKSFYL